VTAESVVGLFLRSHKCQRIFRTEYIFREF